MWFLTREWPMTAGTTPKQADLWRGTAAVCQGRVGEQSTWAVLYQQGDRSFADELFADLFAEVGRRSVPPRIVATVMVLQRLQGLSDREAVDAFSFDARWKYACGGLAFDYPGFSHTVLVDMRARLAASTRPERIFQVTVEAARQAGLVGVRRVLDSTPSYDAVATMDTVTLLGAAIRGLFKVAEGRLAAELRAVLVGGDDYASLAKPQIDRDDQAARAALVDARARDARAVLGALGGRPLPAAVAEAARLLAAVVGQDLEHGSDGSFRIAAGSPPTWRHPRRPRRPSTVTAPMAPGRCWSACTPPASTHGSRSRPRSRPRGTSPTTSSSSTLPPAASPVPQGAPPRSCTTPIRATATTARPASARPVGAARFAASAPARRLAAPSP